VLLGMMNGGGTKSSFVGFAILLGPSCTNPRPSYSAAPKFVFWLRQHPGEECTKWHFWEPVRVSGLQPWNLM